MVTTPPITAPHHQLSTEKEHTQQSLFDYIKKKAAANAARKITTIISDTECGTSPWAQAGIYPDFAAYRAAIRGLIKSERIELVIEVSRLRREARERRPELLCDFALATNVLKAVLRGCKKRQVRENAVADVFGEMKQDCECAIELGIKEEEVKGRLIALVAMMNLFLGEGEMKRVEEIVKLVCRLPAGPASALPIKDYNNAIRLLGKKKYLKGVFAILDLMRASKVEPDNETFEFLANAAVRQVEFVTGSVSMNTLPEPVGSEVAFMGRSNVGKSSLVNMICNRKALAYVSGRPGKTQQFNYFLVNGKDTNSQFYIVDLPGVGYAQVPQHVQDEWLQFMAQYFRHRTSLRLVFHLIDGRHGALADDESLMRQMAASGRRVNEYVIVLTKMDKLDKQKVKQSILDKTRAALVRNGCSADTSIVLTSSESRLGRDEMWRHLRAVLPGK